MSAPRYVTSRGASILAALVFATILISMAGLMSGGIQTERVAVSQGSQNAATAAAAPTMPAAGIEQSTCTPGFDYDVVFANNKPDIKRYNICGGQEPPPKAGKNDLGFGKKSGRCDPNSINAPATGWKCVVRDCFKKPNVTNAAAADSPNVEFCGYSQFGDKQKVTPQQARVQSVAQAAKAGFATSPSEQSALLSPVGISDQKAFDAAYSDQLNSATEAANSAQADVDRAMKKLDELGCSADAGASDACTQAANELKTSQDNLNVQKANLDALDKLSPDLATSQTTLAPDEVDAKREAANTAYDWYTECMDATNDANGQCSDEHAAYISKLKALCDTGGAETQPGGSCELYKAETDCDPTKTACNPNPNTDPNKRPPVTPGPGTFPDDRGGQCSGAERQACASNPNSPVCQRCGGAPNFPGGLGGQKPGGGGNKGGGGQQPQQQCQASYFCSSATAVSYRSAQCQTQISQQCPQGYTCSGNSCQQSPNGVGTDGQPCPPVQPQPSASTCTVGSWQPVRAPNTCQTGWQCNGGTTPGTDTATAQLSCQPPVAEPGMPISVSWSCTNAKSSAGVGFSTGGLLASSTSVTAKTLALGLSTTTVLGLACTDTQNQVVNTQCTVQVVSPWITFVSVPANLVSGGTATLGWITGGMKQCVVSSHDYADFTSQNAGRNSANGSAQTPPLTHASTFWLTCTTVGGNTKEASTTIGVFTQ